MEDTDQLDSFDKDYVRQLRQEAAKYRTELKETRSQLDNYKALEGQLATIRVETELARRGLKVNPSWISVNDGQSPSEAVDNFLAEYPQFVDGVIEEPQQVEPKRVPKSISPSKENAAHPGHGPSGMLGDRSLDDIKLDPVARANLRDFYRDLLRTSSNLPN